MDLHSKQLWRKPAFMGVFLALAMICSYIAVSYTHLYLPSLSKALGVYIPLIVVNCIILGRAESYASKNGPIESIFDRCV